MKQQQPALSRRYQHLLIRVMGVFIAVFFTVNAANARTLAKPIAQPEQNPPTATAAEKDRQSALYRQTLTAIKKGHRSNTKRGMLALSNHPLHPYLLEAELSKRLHQLPFNEVDQFLKTYQNTVVTKKLQKKWLSVLAQKKHWPDFIRYYRADITNNALRCQYLEALHQTGYAEIALDQTTKIWLSGQSMPNSCNPVFKRWQKAGRQTDTLLWQRLTLALDRNNMLLARYLTNRASAELKPYARRMISVHRKPQRLTDSKDFNDGSQYSATILSHGLKRLAAIDAPLATAQWVNYRAYVAFSEQQQRSIRDKIARQVIASGSENALGWLITHDPNAEDSYLLEWRIRLALKQQHWTQAGHWISILPADLRQQPRWQYWLARVYQQTGDALAIPMLEQLATERHYYGFLAADTLKKGYGFNHSAMVTATTAQHIETLPEIQRALAFFHMEELTPARREWFAAVNHFDQQQLIAATSLAHQWGWHQQAIHTTIKAEQWNDLSIRFPLAYQRDMTDSAKSATIRLEWLYAIARQESAFAHDARSSADARGLLQLRPGTAKGVARHLGITFNARDLYSADKNITLGSNYLKQLLAQFQGNHILATAAYNAGPHRVKKWLKHQQTALPYDIWIETLPFHETRNYVQNVLAFSVIYGHRLGLDSPLIGQQELLIGKLPEVAYSQPGY